MFKRRYVAAWLVLTSLIIPAYAAQCPDTSAYQPARDIIEDLGRIVAPDGIEESYTVELGGIPQWINVRGQDSANPVILFVHGGPAAPVIPSSWQFQRPLEDYFTIVNWDQRGAGKTYLEVEPELIEDSIFIQQYVDDAIELAEFVRETYDKEKIILMGHSWGTIVSMHAALQRPDLFYAYAGIGQVINVHENEQISYQHGLDQAKLHDNQEAVDELMSIAPYPGDEPVTRERIIIARKWAQHYGGLSAYRDESMYYFRAPQLSPLYSDAQRCAINDGNVFTLSRLLDEFLEVDFSAVDEFPIPVVMLMGRHDYTTPSEPAAEWLAQVEAPYKKGVWFENSAHMAPWEEPGKTLVSLLRYIRAHAE